MPKSDPSLSVLPTYGHRWTVPQYFFSTDTVGTLEKKYRYCSASTFIFIFLGSTRYFFKIFCNNINHKKGEVCTIAPVHLLQQSFDRFDFKIQYCHPVKRDNKRILFHRKRYFEAEEKWSFRRPFSNAFVFKRQFKVKAFQ